MREIMTSRGYWPGATLKDRSSCRMLNLLPSEPTFELPTHGSDRTATIITPYAPPIIVAFVVAAVVFYQTYQLLARENDECMIGVPVEESEFTIISKLEGRLMHPYQSALVLFLVFIVSSIANLCRSLYWPSACMTSHDRPLTLIQRHFTQLGCGFLTNSISSSLYISCTCRLSCEKSTTVIWHSA